MISVTFADHELARQAATILGPVTGKDPAVDGSTVDLTVEEGPKVAAEVLRALDQHEIAVAGLALREPSLDDVFLSLTGHRAESEDEGGRREDGTDQGGRSNGGRIQEAREAAAAAKGA